MDGNTSDRTTLRGFLDRIEGAYGKVRRVWVMDRGIPTEALLAEMRDPARQTFYLVGTPKGRVNQHEKKWLELPWQQVRESVQVKLRSNLPAEDPGVLWERYVQLTQIEAAFKAMKSELGLRPAVSTVLCKRYSDVFITPAAGLG